MINGVPSFLRQIQVHETESNSQQAKKYLKFCELFHSNAVTQTVNTEGVRTIHFSHDNKKILAGTEDDPFSEWHGHIDIYDNHLKQIPFPKSIKSEKLCGIEWMRTTKKGNLIVTNSVPRDEVYFFDMKTSNRPKIFKIGRLRFKPYSPLPCVYYDDKNERFWISEKKRIVIYQESSHGLEKICTIPLPNKEYPLWMANDPELDKTFLHSIKGHLWIIDKEKMAKFPCICDYYYTYGDQKLKARQSVFYDSENQRLIGKTEENCVTIWDAVHEKEIFQIRPEPEGNGKITIGLTYFDKSSRKLFIHVYETVENYDDSLSMTNSILQVWDIDSRTQTHNISLKLKNYFLCPNQIDYDFKKHVLIIRSGYEIWPWNLKTGESITNMPIKAKSFLWNKEQNELVLVSENGATDRIEMRSVAN